jgi:hypothetical protein
MEKFDMMKDPVCLNEIQQIIRECLDKEIKKIMAKTGLSEIEVLDRLRQVPAVEA